MFCLRSWIPLLFIPTNASPLFIVTFFFLTYSLNRPCVYCSILLLILFVSSCYWSEQCFFDFNSNWFEPRHMSSPLPNPLPQALSQSSTSSIDTTTNATEDVAFLLEAVNQTAGALGNAALQEIERSVVGLEWVRSWLGGREWRVPCLDVNIRL